LTLLLTSIALCVFFYYVTLKTGKSTGIISTPRITHATPAAAYAHVPSRFFESDADVELFSNFLEDEVCLDIPDIASQLIDDNSQIQVSAVKIRGEAKYVVHHA